MWEELGVVILIAMIDFEIEETPKRRNDSAIYEVVSRIPCRMAGACGAEKREMRSVRLGRCIMQGHGTLPSTLSFRLSIQVSYVPEKERGTRETTTKRHKEVVMKGEATVVQGGKTKARTLLFGLRQKTISE